MQHSYRKIARHCLVAAFCGIATACAMVGGEPGLRHATTYQVETPESWRRIARDDSDHAYSLESGSIVTVLSSCDHRSQAPLEVLSNQLLMGTKSRKILAREKQTIGGNTGLWTITNVEVESVSVQLNLFVTKTSECVFDFSLMHRGEVAKRDTEEFRKFIGSFKNGNH